MNSQIIGLPFVDHVDQTQRPAIENPIEFIKEKYSSGYQFGLDNLTRFGVYKLMGYRYNFKPYLKLYLYKQYGQWNEAYAPNKTALRKVTYGKIDKIIEL